jgi:PST family polysaccharide transporter
MYANASSLLALPAVVGQIGVREVLVRSGGSYDRVSGPALSLCVTFGLLASLAMAATIPIGWWLYGPSRTLAGMILLFATSALPNTVIHVPTAKLQIQLRFRTLSVLAFVHQTGMILLTMLFAWLGWGAYSFAAPWPIMAVVRLALTWAAARLVPHGGLQISRWGELIGSSLWVLQARAVGTFVMVGDYLLLGIFHKETVVGVYFFAFNLSLQTLSLLAVNLESVLFPTLNQLRGESQRQRTALLSAVGVLSLIGVPMSLVQMALSDPVVRLLFGAEWYSAIPVLEVLSLGMAIRLVGWPAMSLIQAQGRFRTYALLTTGLAATFLVSVTVAAKFSSAERAPTNVAWAVTFYACIESPLALYVAIRPAGGRFAEVLRAFRGPMLVGGVVAICCFGASMAVPAGVPLRAVFQLIAGGMAATAAFVLAARLLDRQSWDALMSRFLSLLRRNKPGGIAPAVG